MQKRYLSEAEIKLVLERIDPLIPRYLSEDIRESFLHRIRDPLRKQLTEVLVVDHPDVVKVLAQEMEKNVQRAIAQPGEGVGVICAQSIGERQTQLTLNSFHQSGLAVATVVTGVPRFLELLNATKDPKMSSNRFFLNRDVKTPEDMRGILSHHLVSIQFQDIVINDSIHEEKEEEAWYGAFETVYSNQFRDYHACISFHLNLKKLFEYKIPPYLISERLESQYPDICCVFSPIHIGQFDVFVDVSQVFFPESGAPSFIQRHNYIKIYLEDVVKTRLYDVRICGLPGINNFHIMKDVDTQKFYVETEGSNLEGIISFPFVDITSVRSNNMWNIFQIMGIEATREFLIEEFTNIVSSDGTFINPVHILLLVDIMTHHGTINSISRYGLKKEQVGVLSRSSFEESLDHFCNAGFYAEKEPIKAVSAAIMCGKRSKIGTGLCSLMMDWEKMME